MVSIIANLQHYSEASEHTLWCADENISADQVADFKGIVLTNRFDLFETLTSKNIQCIFNDFNVAEALKLRPLTAMVFQIAKEKSINKHLILSFLHLFSAHSELSMFGKKQQGILSLVKFAQSLDIPLQVVKHKNRLIEAQIKHGEKPITPSDYTSLTTIMDTSMISKMGVYGYNKIDVGSTLLIESLAKIISKQAIAVNNLSLLDLGCGYGYLSIKAHELGFNSIDATDNCAGAIIACQKNFTSFAINGSVTASDCAKNIVTKYDVILSNPPFHQGFEHNKSLTEDFISSAKLHLKEKGFALFVVNQFIGLEKIAKKYFKNVNMVLKQSGYKVLALDNNGYNS